MTYELGTAGGSMIKYEVDGDVVVVSCELKQDFVIARAYGFNSLGKHVGMSKAMFQEYVRRLRSEL